MPNAFFRAKMLWKEGNRQAGVALLEDHLHQMLGRPVFSPDPRLFDSPTFDRLDTALWAILDKREFLQAPFEDIYTQIWNLDPSQLWIAFLLDHDFNKMSDYDLLMAEVEPIDQPRFEVIADTLAIAARKGILGSDTTEQPNGGRAVLSLTQIEDVPPAQWGDLKPLLLQQLPLSYAECPPDFWNQLAVTEPSDLLMRFLHDLFVAYDNPLNVVQMRWAAIERQHGDYAAAVRIALHTVLDTADDPEWFDDVVRIDAGFVSVRSGKDWLKALSRALQRGDFSVLLNVA